MKKKVNNVTWFTRRPPYFAGELRGGMIWSLLGDRRERLLQSKMLVEPKSLFELELDNMFYVLSSQTCYFGHYFTSRFGQLLHLFFRLSHDGGVSPKLHA